MAQLEQIPAARPLNVARGDGERIWFLDSATDAALRRGAGRAAAAALAGGALLAPRPRSVLHMVCAVGVVASRRGVGGSSPAKWQVRTLIIGLMVRVRLGLSIVS